MAHKAVRMEVAAFRDTFFPLPEGITASKHPQWPANIFDGLAAGDKLTEQEIQACFVNAVNDHDLMPGSKMSTSSEKPDVTEMGNFKQKLDAAIFKANSLPTDGRPPWADQLVTVEFKRYYPSQDPFFHGEDAKLESNAATRKEVRGQLIDYSEIVFRIQHRTALFMLLIINRRVRVLRWDRSGTIVTRAFDYVATPYLLCEILWRMSLLSDEQLGMDTSASRLCPDDTDYKLMDFLAMEAPNDLSSEGHDLVAGEPHTDRSVFVHVRAKFREAMDSKWPRYRVEVPDGNATRIFLIGKPSFYAQGMACRGTKGYVAWDTRTKRFVWLKDAWRIDYERMEPEGAILGKLNAEGLVNVPTLVCHGDIRNQKTRTPDIWEAQQPGLPTPISDAALVSPSATLVDPSPSSTSSASLKRSLFEMESHETVGDQEEYTLREHAHYRIVVEEVAKPLSDFRRGRQLVGIIMDCVEAHRDAVTKANVVHRDVSSGNILILPKVEYDKQDGHPYVTWKGLLADWELSKPIHKAEPLLRPRQPLRTGTWQFLSVGMLTENPKPVQIPDEIESYFHVLLYFAVRYLRSNCKDPTSFIENYFNSYTYDNGVYTCGARKQHVIKISGRLETGNSVPLLFNSPMDDIFCELLPVFKAYYKAQDHLKAQKAILAPPPKACPPRPPPMPPSPSLSVEERRESRPHKMLRKPRALRQNNEPTPEEKDDAALVEDHEFMLDTLEAAYRSDGWGYDKVGDRHGVPTNHMPHVPLVNARGASAPTMKRRKTTGVGAVPYSLPVRLTQSQVPKAR